MEAESIPPVIEEGICSNNLDIFYKSIFIPFHLSLAGCEAIKELPPSSLGPEQGVPAVDPEVGATSTNFGATEMKPQDEIPLLAEELANGAG